MELKPVTIEKTDKGDIYCKWNDGFSAIISLKDFRDNCPCSLCTSGKSDEPKRGIMASPILAEGKYILDKIEPVGNYAIRAEWMDGHDSGIYTWETLRKIYEDCGKDKLQEK